MKGIIYLRTSTKDQHPELQLKDCQEFARSHDIEVIGVLQEQSSAYKNKGNIKKRLEWQKIISLAKHKEIDCIVLWHYDRCFRNREKFFKFMLEMFELNNVRVYSQQQQYVTELWDMSNNLPDIPAPWDILIKDIMKSLWKSTLHIIGKASEEESSKKSNRVKMAVRKLEGKPTTSYKGNVWGRKSLSKQTINKVLELHKQGLSIRSIVSKVTYWDSNNHKKQISRGAVHKIVSTYCNKEYFADSSVK